MFTTARESITVKFLPERAHTPSTRLHSNTTRVSVQSADTVLSQNYTHAAEWLIELCHRVMD